MDARKTVLGALALSLATTQALAGEGEPKVPPGVDPGGVAVALIDSGVNYTLPHIAPRLARDKDGNLVGHDFADGDDTPYDIVPGGRSPLARRHGSAVASILLAEAPDARLIPYRYHPKDFATFARFVEHVAKGPARIVSMSLGGYRIGDWQHFREAAAAHPEILFVVSAGNDGRDIDKMPIYPPGFDLGNMIVVTSSDDFGRLPRESNWGVMNVDVSTPGEQIETRDHLGARKITSGSSYAAPRIAALAARFKAAHPDWDTQRLKAEILALAAPSPGERVPKTRHGWIANPAIAGPASQQPR